MVMLGTKGMEQEHFCLSQENHLYYCKDDGQREKG